MNMVFSRVITLNDILEALVGDASDFYKDDFQLIERKMAVGWLMGIIRCMIF
jgi:CBS domain containing-hemolysin-like protein